MAPLIAAAWFAASPTMVTATHMNYRVYGLHDLTSSMTNGIDGYIRGSGIIMAHTDNAVLEWVTLHGSGSPGPWVQIGEYQGKVGICPGTKCISSPTGVRHYYETWSCSGAAYSIVDLGSPPLPNYPVYVNWAGGYNLSDCGGSWYFPFRLGSWTSQPKGTGRMHGSLGYPQAALEDRFVHGQPHENINTVWFGLDAQGNVNSGFSLHLYTYASNSWARWTHSATFAGTGESPSGIPNPLIYIPRRYFDAFQVTD